MSIVASASIAVLTLAVSPLLLGDMHVQPPHEPAAVPDKSPFIIVLGIAQDGGYPQPGCAKQCCAAASHDHARARHVSSLALVDPKTGQRWLFDCTPDFREQLRLLDEATQGLDAPNPSAAAKTQPRLDGIFLTHAHIGHYTGLIFLGHEVLGARETPVYVMPRMREFLSTQGPWDQLVRYRNIVLRDLEENQPVRLNDRLTVTPIRVPHREEYSEVVGFRIDGPNRSVLFIPDIDKWERWERRIEDLIGEVDIAFLDGTFFADGELANRDMSQIPHPFMEESLGRFGALDAEERGKIRFIHLNHTNPALDPESAAHRAVERAGMHIAEQGKRHTL